MPIELIEMPDFVKKLQDISTADIKTCPPDIGELWSTIDKMKNGKSTNDIPMAYIKHASRNDEFMKEMLKEN